MVEIRVYRSLESELLTLCPFQQYEETHGIGEFQPLAWFY
jgi:hypothetical protein